ncbi:disease resistance protein SUMM2-like [Gossypium arboreum]|uniref:AAA+ ATPase domain-containing protein n=1 Tax=Gossypium arboreum TaxID=29729 RepID=A0ABR0NHX1_GOSAR|nr:disease resistance protein SUMM2-like [Gossypium arboreum]KAK5793533.1 hypothetical protein PVK06_034683 [Gossypium arboreum]
MEAAIIEVVKICLSCSCNWLLRNYAYVKDINSNRNKLKEAKKMLVDKKRDIESDTDSSRRSDELNTLLRNVATRIDEIGRVEKQPVTYLCGLCPFRHLYKLGKSIVKNTNEATSLYNELREYNELRNIRRMPTPTRQRQNHKCVWENQETIVMHSSLKEKVEELLGWLKDSRSKRICIMGPAGIGKTTLMKTVRDIVKKSCDFGFDHIFYLSATETTESKQKNIWDLLGKGRNEDTHHRERETVISEELRTKKYLLFLDDVLSEVNLKEVGIHSDHEYGRIVFACRDKYTGHTDIDMTLKPLSPEDATMLFWKAVGSERMKGPDAKKIIGLCGGMPPILNLIGRCLRGKDDPKRWRDVKRQLQCPNMQGWEEFQEYYNFLKIVYKELPTDEYKDCLLYWAIFPLDENINGDHIIECWSTEQFLEPERLCEARDRGYTILDDFVDKFLLQKGETSEHFKMFLWFQKAALKIANEEKSERVFVENGKSIKELEWIHGNRVLFARTDLSLLPKKPECRGMVTLLLHENNTSHLPEQFFARMRDLKLLGLQETKIRELPSSITRLRHLKGLFLYNCHLLVQLPREIRALKNLQILVVHHAGIYSLPSEIGQLGNLKCLRIIFKEAAQQNQATAESSMGVKCLNCKRENTKGKIIPCKVIEKLSKLEESSIHVSPIDKTWQENADVIGSEITELKELTHLQFYFTNMKSFVWFTRNSKSWNANDEKSNDKKSNDKKFRSFNISIGQDDSSASTVFEFSAEENLKFSGGNGFPEAVFEVLKRAISFELIGHTTACNLTDNLPADAFKELKKLKVFTVEECTEMKSIITGDANLTGNSISASGIEKSLAIAFECLEELHVRKLPKLESIWQGEISSESFKALTTLTLKECDSITILFKLEMVRQLSQLKNLQVEDCRGIQEIIETNLQVEDCREIEAEGPVASTSFTSLKNFQLCGLTSLSSICDASLEWPSLETILVKECEDLKSLPHILPNASKLTEIQCAEAWWEQQDWPEGAQGRFSNLHPQLNH